MPILLTHTEYIDRYKMPFVRKNDHTIMTHRLACEHLAVRDYLS